MELSRTNNLLGVITLNKTIHKYSYMYFRYLKYFSTRYRTPQKQYIDVYYFCVVKMEELFAIAVSFAFFVRNRGFPPPSRFSSPWTSSRPVHLSHRGAKIFSPEIFLPREVDWAGRRSRDNHQND